MITHEAPGDTFWDKVRAGAEQAAKNDGVDLKYSNDPDGTRQATLVQNAIDSKVDGIAVTLTRSTPSVRSRRRLPDAGIPVVAFNGGITDYQKYGISTYFGSDEDVAGQAVGQRLARPGYRQSHLRDHRAGQRRAGGPLRRGARRPTRTPRTSTSTAPTCRRSRRPWGEAAAGPVDQHHRRARRTVRDAAMQAKTGANSQAKVVSFDLNSDLVQAIKDKQVQFTVDQQPYVQGYMAVEALWLTSSTAMTSAAASPCSPARVRRQHQHRQDRRIRREQHPIAASGSHNVGSLTASPLEP